MGISRNSRLFVAMLALGGGLATWAAESGENGEIMPAQDMVLWYRQPAATWVETLPIGNGMIGARVFGGVNQERIALNESTFWSGRPHDYDSPEASQYFPQIRDLVFAGKFQEADKIANEHFMGKPVGQQAFQPLGDLLLSFENGGEAKEYRRELDMRTGVVRTTYRSGDDRFMREVFVSYPDRVMVVRISGDKPGRVSLRAQLKSHFVEDISATPGKLVMAGGWSSKLPVTDWVISRVDGKGLRFQTVLQAFPEGGQSETTNSALRVRGADSVTFILAAATSFVNYHDISGDPAAACEKILSGVRGKDYATLFRRHEADFRSLMGRVQLKVGDDSRKGEPTDERLKAVHEGGSDPDLEAQCFQFGRYILAASSRAGGQPANLQGIWNEATSPNWGSKYTININTEMNYWLAEVCNLAECHQPLFGMLKDISETGARTAKTYYGCEGWVAHHNIDLWRGTAPVDAACYGMWPVGGAWLCRHLWEHYEYGGDRKFLAEYYPVMKGSALFLLTLMVEHPKYHWLVTPFSMSPEHGFVYGNGKNASLSPSPTMDIAITRDLFTHCIEASRILGVDGEFRGKLESALKRLPPYQVNSKGYLQEWIEDWQPVDHGHNMSPDFAFFPGTSITLRGTPELAAVIRKGMEEKPARRGGWPLAWSICMWARLERGDKVGEGVTMMLRNSLAPNLHNKGCNQSDASFGLTAGIAEALLQSHAGEICLLPALPASWPDGAVKGLRARGGLEVSMRWRGGKLQSAEIFSDKATECLVRYGTKTTRLTLNAGQSLHVNAALEVTPP